MKNKSNSMKNWEHLDNNWKSKLEGQHELVSENLWSQIEAKLEGKNKKKGIAIWIYSQKWSIAASVAVVLILGWTLSTNDFDQTDKVVGKTINPPKVQIQETQILEKEKEVKTAYFSKNQNHFKDVKLKEFSRNILEENEEIKVSQRVDFLPQSSNLINSPASSENLAQMATNSESQSSTSNLVPATSLAQEDQILVVEIEKTPKKKFLKRALDFIEKVKEGKLVQAVQAKNKKEEGKMNDEIHQVLNKIVEKEENIKRYISL